MNIGEVIARMLINELNHFAMRRSLIPFQRQNKVTTTITDVQQTTAVNVTDVFVDKGYRGHNYSGDATIHATCLAP